MKIKPIESKLVYEENSHPQVKESLNCLLLFVVSKVNEGVEDGTIKPEFEDCSRMRLKDSLTFDENGKPNPGGLQGEAFQKKVWHRSYRYLDNIITGSEEYKSCLAITEAFFEKAGEFNFNRFIQRVVNNQLNFPEKNSGTIDHFINDLRDVE